MYRNHKTGAIAVAFSLLVGCLIASQPTCAEGQFEGKVSASGEAAAGAEKKDAAQSEHVEQKSEAATPASEASVDKQSETKVTEPAKTSVVSGENPSPNKDEKPAQGKDATTGETKSGDLNKGSVDTPPAKAAVDLQAKDPDYIRGSTLYNKKQYAQATTAFSSAIKNHPDGAAGYLSRGQCYEQAKNYAGAVGDFSHYLQSNPHDVSALGHRGHCYSLQRQFSPAVQDYSAALILLPPEKLTNQNDYLLVDRGFAYVGLGQYQPAVADLSAYLARHPKDANLEAIRKRASAYEMLNKYPAALADYNVLAQRCPNDANVFSDRMRVHMKLGNYKLANQDWFTARKLDPTGTLTHGDIMSNSQIVQQQANIALKGLSPNEAVNLIFQRMHESFGTPGADVVRVYARARQEYVAGHYQQALQFFNQTLQMGGYKPDLILDKRGMCYLKLGQYQYALDDFSKAIDGRPDDYLYHQHRAMAYSGLHMQAQAIKESELARDLESRLNASGGIRHFNIDE